MVLIADKKGKQAQLLVLQLFLSSAYTFVRVQRTYPVTSSGIRCHSPLLNNFLVKLKLEKGTRCSRDIFLSRKRSIC